LVSELQDTDKLAGYCFASLEPFFANFPEIYLDSLGKVLDSVTDTALKCDVIRGLLGEEPNYKAIVDSVVNINGLTTAFGSTFFETERIFRFFGAEYTYFRVD
jgi:hypothetical protein